MKTDKRLTGTKLTHTRDMVVKITKDFSIHVSHKDGMCDLNALFEYGNRMRVAGDKKKITLGNWISSLDTCEFIMAHEELTYSNLKLSLEITSKGGKYQVVGPKNCYIAGTSRVNKSKADLILTLKAAAALDKHLEVIIYTMFIRNQILVRRDDSGDNYKQLKQAILDYLPAPNGTVGWRLINVSKVIKKRIIGTKYEHLLDGYPDRKVRNDWDFANPKELLQREALQDKLLAIIEFNPTISSVELLKAAKTLKLKEV